MKSGTVGLQMTRPVVAKKEKKKKVNRRHKSSSFREETRDVYVRDTPRV